MQCVEVFCSVLQLGMADLLWLFVTCYSTLAALVSVLCLYSYSLSALSSHGFPLFFSKQFWGFWGFGQRFGGFEVLGEFLGLSGIFEQVHWWYESPLCP
mmetsp:Transcript_30063/g.48472  ORF Transcript_30063/g.48472 Transcript_30063/m.48472 type:complete len:99 (+) Transcript_30063:32-328(+)